MTDQQESSSNHEAIVAEDLALKQSASWLVNLVRVVGLGILVGLASGIIGVVSGPEVGQMASVIIFAPMILWFFGRLTGFSLPFSAWRAVDIWIFLFFAVITLVSLSLFLNSWYGSYVLDYLLQIPLFN